MRPEKFQLPWFEVEGSPHLPSPLVFLPMEQEILLCLTQTVFNDGTAASMANMNAATGKLKSYERSNVTEFVPALHKILGRTDIDPAILQSCATLFKNLVRLHWVSALL